MTTTLKNLQRIAVAVTVLVGGALVWEHQASRAPAAAAYQAASDAFGAREWRRARELFAEVVRVDASNFAARRGLANSLVQLSRFDDALKVMDGVIADEPSNACNYATRGIVSDHLERYSAAMKDYAHAVAGCREAVIGMTWMQRLLTNTHERPPTIAERLNYLRAQMQLPAENRVLRLPEMDRVQRPWTT